MDIDCERLSIERLTQRPEVFLDELLNAVRNLGVVRYLHSRDDVLPPLRNRGGDTLNFCGRLVIELRRSTNAGARRRRGEKTSVICACLAG